MIGTDTSVFREKRNGDTRHGTSTETDAALPLLLDTDFGSDCDDAMALAYLLYAQRSRKIELRAVTYSNGCPDGPTALRAFFRTLGEAAPPIGKTAGEAKSYDRYCAQTVARFGAKEDCVQTPDAVQVLRKALSELGAGERAVLCAIGPMTNIAALLQSTGDGYSPLDGVSLIREKCEKLVVMAGDFRADAAARPPEWNVKLDVPAARTVIGLCPVPTVFLPFEVGENMMTGKPMMEEYGETTPLSLAFVRFPGVLAAGGRHSWDPAAVLYAAEGCGDAFTESKRGTVTLDAEGRTFFAPKKNGLHSVLSIRERGDLTDRERKDLIAGYIDICAMRLLQQG